jgi:hypothetical protein
MSLRSWLTTYMALPILAGFNEIFPLLFSNGLFFWRARSPAIGVAGRFMSMVDN